MPAYNDIFFRRGASTSWSTTNPILRAAEVGYDTTEKKFKIGDGTTTWNNLEWASVIGVSGEQIFPESLHNLSGIYFDTTIDDVDQVAGQLNWNVDAGTLDIGLSDSLNTHIGQDVFYRVQNATGSTIYKGQSVYAAGVTAGGQRMQIAKYVADGSIDEVRFLGLATEDIANGEIGFVTHFGFVKNVDTRTTNTLINPGAETWNEGDILFAHPSTAGGLTKTKPQDDIYVSIVLGTGSAGELFVRPTNPGHINDLHDVDTTNLVDNNFLVWKDSAGYFEPSSGLYYVDDKLGVGTSSPNAIVHAYGDTPSGTVLNVEGTNGSLFSVVDNLSGALMSVNTIAGLPVLEVNSDYSVIAGRFNQNDLVVASNGNVGVGIGSPTYKLHVDGTFRVEDVSSFKEDATFLGDVTAVSFVKSGGSSSQFLKADGSVDSSTYLTSHPAISAASSSNNSNRTYIQDVLLDSFGHVTGIATATETVTNTNTYVTSASFNTTNGIVTLTRNDAGTVTVDLDGRYLTSQTSHADVLVDGDFTTAGLMKTNGAGTYSIVTDNSSNWNTAYGWGDHSTEGYLTANQTITLTGDVSGTGTTSISVVVANDSHTHDTRYYTETEVDNLLSAKLSTSLKGAANGLAELDGTGKVPSAQLPSYVDDVLEHSSSGNFPATGDSGKIYIAQDTNLTYRWSGSAYVEISASLALGTTSTTAFRGDYGNTAYTHSQATTGSVHGSTTVGGNFLRLSNPSAITFIRVNADNTVSTLDATSFRTAIGAGTSSSTGTVTSVAAGNGLDFTTINTTGSVTLGTPSNVTLASTNSVSATSHTHAFAPGGSTSQYIRGDGSLATFPSVLTTSTSFGGDVTGTYNAIVIADDSHNHVISNIDNLQTTLDGKVDNGGGPASNGYLAIWEDSTTITYDANVYYDSTNDYFGVNTNSPNASLHVYSSTPSGTVFNVEGTNGSLFSVVDNLSGTLMSVNNNAGLPVFEVFDDDTIVGGRFAQNDFVVTTGGDVGIGTANPVSKLQVNGTVTATSIVKSGGTSSQFLKADGSVDSTAYTTCAGTVTSVAAGNGLNFTTITGAGSVTLGTPGEITLSSSNSVSATSHTHEFVPGGTSAQYIRGNGTLATFPTVVSSTDLAYVSGVAVYASGDVAAATDAATGDTLVRRGQLGDFYGSVIGASMRMEAPAFETDGGTSSQFVKGDGSLDSNAYTTCTGTVTGTGSAANLLTYWTTTGSIGALGTSTYPSLTEVSYVKGVTSSIQTQINSKTSCTGTVTGLTAGTAITVGTGATPSVAVSATCNTAWNAKTTCTGTVTSVSAGNGLDFTSISTTGSVTLGTPGSTTLSSTNAVTTTSHTHAFAPGGTTAQYIRGDGTLATLPTYTVNNGTLTMAVSGTGLSGSATFTANQSGNSTFTVTSNATSANTVSTIVARDASGNFSAGTITANQVNVDNLRLDGNTLSSTNTNGNIVITPNGTGGIAAGTSATVTGGYATVSGGYFNCASGSYSTVSGGYGNCASGSYSTVGGGSSNTASASYSTVSGGANNTSSGFLTTVGGGLFNTASASYSTVGGGYGNTASGGMSTVSGGRTNTASGNCSTVSGGSSNCASGTNSSVFGGCCNITNARHSTINGGHRNIIQSPTNECCSSGVTIGGGVGHNSSGGTLNATTGDLTGTITCCNAGAFSTIAGGLRNCATGVYSTIGGGYCNSASAIYSTVSGGRVNTVSGNCSTIGGGLNNTASGYGSTISGGISNCISASYGATIGGGGQFFGTGHTASGYFSTIGGGGGLFGGANTASGNYSTIGGGRSNITSGNTSTIGGGTLNSACGDYSTVGGGSLNCTSGSFSIISGGYYAKASKYGELSHAAGRFAQTGDAQHSTLVARRNTTDATANQVLFLNGSSERLVIPAETTWMFEIKLAAHNDTNNDGAWWTFRGGIKRDAANGTSIIGSVIEENSKDTNMSTASASVVADDTNEALEIRVTGVASKNIRWVAVVDISQVSWGTP